MSCTDPSSAKSLTSHLWAGTNPLASTSTTTASSPPLDSARPRSFRSQDIPYINDDGNQGKDWDDFVRGRRGGPNATTKKPGNQFEALPPWSSVPSSSTFHNLSVRRDKHPFSPSPSPFVHEFLSSFGGQEGSHHHDDETGQNVDEEAYSPKWNPESYQPSSAPSSPVLDYSPQLGSAKGRGKSSGSGWSTPTMEEANEAFDDLWSRFSHSSSSSVRSLSPSASKGWIEEFGEGGSGRGDVDGSGSPHHPISTNAHLDAEWDYERLFGTKRWMDDGDEFLNDSCEGGGRVDMGGAGAGSWERSRSRSVDRHSGSNTHRPIPRKPGAMAGVEGKSPVPRSRSRLREEIFPDGETSRSREADVVMEEEGEREKSRKVHEKLRETAMSRLGVISAHFDWEPR